MTFTYTGRDAWLYGTVDGWETGGDAGYGILCDSDGISPNAYEALGLPGNLLGGCRGMMFGENEINLYVRGRKRVEIWRVIAEAEAGAPGSVAAFRQSRPFAKTDVAAEQLKVEKRDSRGHRSKRLSERVL